MHTHGFVRVATSTPQVRTADVSFNRDGIIEEAKRAHAAHVDLPDGTTHLSAVNIGVRPTVEHHGELLVEAHLLDFDEDIYDQQIDVCFRRWLRNEHRFDGVDQLVSQLQKDVLDTRLILQ